MVSSSGENRVIHPGPDDPSLLRLQNIHVSEHIWDSRDHPILKVRKSQFIPPGLDGVPEEILPHLELARFTGIAHYVTPIGGNYANILEESLGIRPSRADFVGSFLKTSWLDQHFTHVAMHAQNPLHITRFARAYMLRLIGVILLRFLYRELCMATNIDRHGLGRLAALLVMWLANQRNRKGRKDISYYRYKFDMLTGEEIIWQPYSIDLINSLPVICREGMEL
ncbi:uncharacterized protein LOC113855684 [Abrus precatorius]|uniref:Uncharacterized protein LOC113855684 n=1 Tax=Abrus precatorius TaxID=3816 RepID=A0A8B8KH24_ABRPR|nr:uncharacterized protein LOC113855684 [Abrus precatorius]